MKIIVTILLVLTLAFAIVVILVMRKHRNLQVKKANESAELKERFKIRKEKIMNRNLKNLHRSNKL